MKINLFGLRTIFYFAKNRTIKYITPFIFVVQLFCKMLRSVYKELHADHETGATDNK